MTEILEYHDKIIMPYPHKHENHENLENQTLTVLYLFVDATQQLGNMHRIASQYTQHTILFHRLIMLTHADVCIM